VPLGFSEAVRNLQESNRSGSVAKDFALNYQNMKLCLLLLSRQNNNTEIISNDIFQKLDCAESLRIAIL
jgi:hypothetical protein